MSDTSPEALSAWCEQKVAIVREQDKHSYGFAPELARWEALAAIVRAHQERPTRAQVEALPQFSVRVYSSMYDPTGRNIQTIERDAVLALYGPEAPTTGGEEP